MIELEGERFDDLEDRGLHCIHNSFCKKTTTAEDQSFKLFTYCESDEVEEGSTEEETSIKGYNNDDLEAALSRARYFMNVDQSDYQCFRSDDESKKCNTAKCLILGQKCNAKTSVGFDEGTCVLMQLLQIMDQNIENDFET